MTLKHGDWWWWWGAGKAKNSRPDQTSYRWPILHIYIYPWSKVKRGISGSVSVAEEIRSGHLKSSG